MNDWLTRLRTLIEASGITQQELARHADIDRSTLSRYLNGSTPLPTSVLMALLQRLGASLADLQPVNHETRMLFRSDDPTARELPAVCRVLHRFGTYSWLEDELAGSPVREATLPIRPIYSRKGNESTIAESAQHIRVCLGAPSTGPLPNLIEFLQVTLKVLQFEHGASKPDGFSAKHPDWGLCLALNTADRPVERVLFTAAHELGHLALGHMEIPVEDQLRVKPKEMEQAADLFAGCFLVPGDDLRRFVKSLGAYRKAVSLLTLVELKKTFGVSLHCVLTRLLGEGLITGSTYGHYLAMLYPDHSTKEPYALRTAPDYERRLRLLALTAYHQGIIGEQKLAETLGRPLEDTLQLLAGTDFDDQPAIR